MSITPILLADTTRDRIEAVLVLGHQLAAGDIVAVPAYIGQSKRDYRAGYCYEIVSIQGVNVNEHGRPTHYEGIIRYEYGGLDTCEWNYGGSGLRYTVVGGAKLLRANTDADAVVYLSGRGWDYRVGRE